MNDQIAMLLRYALIMGGSYLAGKGGLPAEQVGPLADQIIQLGGGVAALGSALWGVYVKWNTKTVSATTGARANVPTLSALTGAVEK